MNVFGMVTTRPSSEYTDHALRSFFETTDLGEDDLFFLVDNDGACDRPLHHSYPRVELIRNRAPLGFAANVNQVMRIARGRRADLFVLNNDLVFTPEWIRPLVVSDAVVLSPLSNFQLPYRCNGFVCGPLLDLSDYLGGRNAFRQIVRAHQANVRGYKAVLAVPFFCVKIPYAVYASVGYLDERFGPGGGEDYDYCLRCHRAGFRILFALGTSLLHFMGKSTWRGAETSAQSRKREHEYQKAFRDKWGDPLLQVVVFGKLDLLRADEPLWRELNRHNFRFVIEQLLEVGKERAWQKC